MPYEEIITLWLLTHYFRGKAAELGAAGYDLLRNYYSEYIRNQYFAKNLLDRSISNTMAFLRFAAGAKKKKRDRSFRFYPFLYNQPKTERGAEASPSMKLLSKRRAVRCTWASARGRRRLPARACRLPLLRRSSRRFSAVSRPS